MVEGLTNSVSILTMVIFGCIVSLTVLIFAYRKINKMSVKLDRLEKELRVANGSMIAMGQQIIDFEKSLQSSNNSGSLFKQALEDPAQTEKPSMEPRLPSSLSESDKIEGSTSSMLDSGSDIAENDSLYDRARASLSKGLSVAEVAKQCSLSFAEVSLLQSLSKSSVSS